MVTDGEQLLTNVTPNEQPKEKAKVWPRGNRRKKRRERKSQKLARRRQRQVALARRRKR